MFSRSTFCGIVDKNQYQQKLAPSPQGGFIFEVLLANRHAKGKAAMMKKQEMNRILREETQHISSDKAKRWQALFRMTYNVTRRHDLGQNPATKRRESFLRCLEDMRQTFPDFNPVDLDYDISFFGPVPLDSKKPGEAGANERRLIIAEKDKVLRRLDVFAKRNNLELFNGKGSLHVRVGTIARNNGACPCLPKERPHCPCPQAIQECKENGECFCRVFLTQDWEERWKAKGLI